MVSLMKKTPESPRDTNVYEKAQLTPLKNIPNITHSNIIIIGRKRVEYKRITTGLIKSINGDAGGNTNSDSKMICLLTSSHIFSASPAQADNLGT